MAAYKTRTTRIAEILTSLREIHGDTQETVATALGITRGAYIAYELSKAEPPMATIAKLSQYYHIPVGVFYDM